MEQGNQEGFSSFDPMFGDEEEGVAKSGNGHSRTGAVMLDMPEEAVTMAVTKIEEAVEKTVKKQGKKTFSKGKGLTFTRRFTQQGIDPYDELTWETRTASIIGEKGDVVFEQLNVEVPSTWSQLATNVVSSKYFRGQLGTPQREFSVKQLVGRVVETITQWGILDNYFATEEDAEVFRAELKFILVNQMASFNSPVWFNIGWEGRRQASSACYINEVVDNMESILDLYKIEGMLFKDGSGSGVNLSSLRSSKEKLSAGGYSSGPVSFMKGFDASAGSIKSGGSTRRAACMRVLNVDHPDIIEFIASKAEAEKKAHALIEAGFTGAFNVPGGAYDTVPYQNANHSVRATDDFMSAVEKNSDWQTCSVVDRAPMATFRARDVMNRIADAAWVCGDPGMQYHDTINRWHTCLNSDQIHASNPCSEFMFLNNTACNLASLNLMEFRTPDGDLDVDAFKHAIQVVLTAQEMLIGNSDYPTPKITEMSNEYRPLGMGYANLGALLMERGLPYDSDEGRTYAAAITAIMTGEAYRQSAIISRDCGGPFSGYKVNREPALRVMRQHREAIESIDSKLAPEGLLKAARTSWDDVLTIAGKHGLRNAQASVLAPTGTIGFMMDCDTTGIEPDIALVKYKTLVGGGMMKIVNQTVPDALLRLGYSSSQIADILSHIESSDTIEDAPHLKDEDLPVFDCAFRPAKGERSIVPMGHVKMMSAVQPFISGAISKTVNMPNETTPEEIADTYLQAWKLGLKAIAIYRDGCKKTQPLNTKKPDEEKAGTAQVQTAEPAKPKRRRLSDERQSITHKFSVGGHEGYVTVGLYDDGMPGEIFITMSKEGSVISGLMDAFATSISMALQYGVPLDTLVDKFSHMRFEPSGFTGNKQIPFAKSIMDYLFRWLGLKFGRNGKQEAQLSLEDKAIIARTLATDEKTDDKTLLEREKQVFATQSDAPPCPDCGMILVRNGSCYKCLNCGMSYGCS